MQNNKIASILVIGLLLSSCSQDEEPAEEAVETQGFDAQAASAEAVMGVELPDECRGFVDGSSRSWTLAGIGLGDDISRVRQQLQCGELVFELEEHRNGYTDNEYRNLNRDRAVVYMTGRSGEEGVSVFFAGLPGAERVIKVTRGAQYDRGPGPSVASLIESIRSKFPEATDITDGGRQEFGYATTASGEAISNPNEISACAFQNRQIPTCGRAFNVYLYPDNRNNPDLIERYGSSLANGAVAFEMIEAAKDGFRAMEDERRANEVEQAGDVQGF